MSSKNSLFVDKILDRYKKVHDLKSYKQVAERMGLSESAFSNQRKRGSVDLEKLITSCDDDINIHWIITGEGPEKINDKVSRVTEKFSEYEALITDGRSNDIPQDQFLEFVLKQQEALVEFLRMMKDRSEE